MADTTGEGDRTGEQEGRHVLQLIENAGVLSPGTPADEAAGAVLCPLLEALEEDDVLLLLGLVPASVRAFIRRCRLRSDLAPAPALHEFLGAVGAHLPFRGRDAEPVTRAVFAALQRHLSPAAIERIEHQLVGDVGDLWHATAARDLAHPPP